MWSWLEAHFLTVSLGFAAFCFVLAVLILRKAESVESADFGEAKVSLMGRGKHRTHLRIDPAPGCDFLDSAETITDENGHRWLELVVGHTESEARRWVKWRGFDQSKHDRH